ncbi:MAG: enoyl-CoA hydratase [Pseudomonadota bacterium]
MGSTENLVERQDDGAVTTLTLSNPSKLNALSRAMIGALTATLDTLAEDADQRVIVIKGAGKAFCAGHDLRELSEARQNEDGGAEALKALFDACAAMMVRLGHLPQPVIAQVHGIATAAGCQLAASCDMVVAAEDARFGVNGVNIGLFCSTPMVALTRAIPRKKAFEMLTTGDFISASEAEHLGLVNHVVAPEALEAQTRELAAKVAGKLGAAVRIGKAAFYEQLTRPLEDAYNYTGNVIVQNMMREDTSEGVRAFLEKRPPDWDQ